MIKKILIVVFILTISACDDKEKQTDDQIKAVKTIEATKASNISSRGFSGIVKNIAVSDLSFMVSGKVEEVKVNLGEEVKEDQILAKIEPKDYQLAVNSLKANLQSAKADLITKKQEFTRQKNLFEKSFISKASFEKSQSAYQAALSNVQIAGTELEKAQNDLERTVLRAPFAGKIATKNIEPFTQIKAGSPVFTIQGESGMEVEISLPESLIGNVKYKDSATVTFPSLPKIKIEGEISKIAAKSETGNSYPVTIALPSAPDELRSGMTAQVSIYNKNADGEDVFLIPTSAVDLRFFDPNSGNLKEKAPLFIVDENSKLKTIYVKIVGVRGNNLAISEGLKDGDQVVVAGVSFLSEGQIVKKWDPKYSVPATISK